MTETEVCCEVRTEWKSHTMRAIEASLTPGTLPNAVLQAAVFLALKNHRMQLAAASVIVSQAAELWQSICETDN